MFIENLNKDTINNEIKVSKEITEDDQVNNLSACEQSKLLALLFHTASSCLLCPAVLLCRDALDFSDYPKSRKSARRTLKVGMESFIDKINVNKLNPIEKFKISHLDGEDNWSKFISEINKFEFFDPRITVVSPACQLRQMVRKLGPGQDLYPLCFDAKGQSRNI